MAINPKFSRMANRFTGGRHKASGKFRGPVSRHRAPGRGRGRGPRLSFTIGLDEAKSWFFDRDDWNGILDVAERKALSKVGAILMRTARGMIRRRKNPSRPPRPPSNWTGLLKEKILFFYDELGGNVIVGPVFLPRPHRGVYTIDQKTIPATLEFGGRERVMEEQWIQGRRNRGPIVLPARRVVMIHARPYMGPALEKKKDVCVGVFEDILGTTPEVSYVANRLADRHRRAA